MSTSYKQIAFDIDTKIARQIAGQKYTKMYKIIQSFMERNSFIHQQGSVYTSTRKFSSDEIDEIITAFSQKYPYISKTIRDIVMSNVSRKTYSLNKDCIYTGHADEYADYYKTHDINDKNKAPQR